MSNKLLEMKVHSLELANLNELKFDAKFDNRISSNSIDHLNHINIFIGSNNAGKSRLMRTIANTMPQRFSYALKGFDKLESLLRSMQEDFQKDVVQHPQVAGVADINAAGQRLLADINFLQFNTSFLETDTDHFKDFVAIMDAFINRTVTVANYRGGGAHDEATLKTLLFDFANKHISTIEMIRSISGEVPAKSVCYIPAIRSLNEFGVGGGNDRDDFISIRVRGNYGLADHVDIFTGQRIYKRIKSLLLGDHKERAKVKDYEDFLSKKLFDGKPVTIIPKERFDVIDVKIGDDEEKRIYELGDGIQALIILTFPLFEYDQGLFFIEEPEVNLHPGMQRKLLEAIQEKKQHQYFLTTHSNHFLDLTIQYQDISVYLCKKVDQKCEIEVVAYGERSILEELGAQNTSVFLTNKTIWVEGITDRLYIAKFLELYINKNNLPALVEDQDYAYVEYGGGNITHWSFLDKFENSSNSAAKISAKRLCGQMILVADGDSAEAKQKRKNSLKEELGDRFIELEAREIENLLPISIISTVVEDYEGESSGVLKGVKEKDFIKEYLGHFIDWQFINKNLPRKRKAAYAADSGTIKDKVAFCKKATRYLTDYDELTLEAQGLAEKIYKFIKD